MTANADATRERCLLALLGAWLMGSLVMFAVAPTNFWVVDELLHGPSNASFRALVEQLQTATAREFLRYLSSELNRVLFLRWNLAQLALGLTAVWLVWRVTTDRTTRALCVAACLSVIALLVVFTPLITALGRSLDFVPRQPPPAELGRFQLLHVGYTLLDVLKVVGLAVAGFRLVRRAR